MSEEGERRRTFADRLLHAAEDVVYVGIAILLLVGCGVLLVVAVEQLLGIFDGLDSGRPIVNVLDTLLLVFILVELLYAVRITVAERQLVAEPFLLVGIIASIKEIVILSVEAAEEVGGGEKFRDQLWEIGVLSVAVVLLGGTAWLLRLKEREPEETDTPAADE